jgi:hypothetical protein
LDCGARDLSGRAGNETRLQRGGLSLLAQMF